MVKKCDLLSQWISTAESTAPQDRDNRMEFWGRELRRTWSFLMDHEAEYIAWLMDNGRLKHPAGAVARKQTQSGSVTEIRQFIEAGVGYFEYVQGKLDQLRSVSLNSYFLRA